MSEKLLPCPFCGGPATEMVGLVGCERCAIGRRSPRSWNTRNTASAPPARDEVRCSHEAYQGRCAHCDVELRDGKPVRPAADDAGLREQIAAEIEAMEDCSAVAIAGRIRSAAIIRGPKP